MSNSLCLTRRSRVWLYDYSYTWYEGVLYIEFHLATRLCAWTYNKCWGQWDPNQYPDDATEGLENPIYHFETWNYTHLNKSHTHTQTIVKLIESVWKDVPDWAKGIFPYRPHLTQSGIVVQTDVRAFSTPSIMMVLATSTLLPGLSVITIGQDGFNTRLHSETLTLKCRGFLAHAHLRPCDNGTLPCCWPVRDFWIHGVSMMES